jgi:hypothetical protein
MGDDYGGGLGYTYTAESEASTPLLDAGNDQYVSNAEESDTPTFCQRFGSSCVGLLVRYSCQSPHACLDTISAISETTVAAIRPSVSKFSFAVQLLNRSAAVRWNSSAV